MDTFFPIFVISIMVLAVVGLMLGLSSWIGPKSHNPAKDQPFECGVDPISSPKEIFSVKFYTVAQLFIIFDIELIFLFPWAVRFKKLGLFGLFEMGFFLIIVIIGLIYAWKEGMLEWE